MSKLDSHGKRNNFVDELAADAVMNATILRAPIHGKETIAKLVDAVGTLFSTMTPAFLGVLDGRTLMEYDAVLISGEAIHGTAVATRNAAGEIDRITVSHSPLTAVLALSEGVRVTLQGELGRDLFI